MKNDKERAILCWFKTKPEAEKAVKELKNIGVETTQIAETSAFPHTEMTEQIMNPATGRFSGLGELTFGNSSNSNEAGILKAVDPNSSGMSDKHDGMETDALVRYNHLLTVVTNENLVEPSVRIMKENGGLT